MKELSSSASSSLPEDQDVIGKTFVDFAGDRPTYVFVKPTSKDILLEYNGQILLSKDILPFLNHERDGGWKNDMERTKWSLKQAKLIGCRILRRVRGGITVSSNTKRKIFESILREFHPETATDSLLSDLLDPLEEDEKRLLAAPVFVEGPPETEHFMVGEGFVNRPGNKALQTTLRHSILDPITIKDIWNHQGVLFLRPHEGWIVARDETSILPKIKEKLKSARRNARSRPSVVISVSSDASRASSVFANELQLPELRFGSLSYSTHNVTLDGTVLNRNQITKLRETYGYCLFCPCTPTKLWRVTIKQLEPKRYVKEALTVPGKSDNGVCLRCKEIEEQRSITLNRLGNYRLGNYPGSKDYPSG